MSKNTHKLNDNIKSQVATRVHTMMQQVFNSKKLTAEQKITTFTKMFKKEFKGFFLEYGKTRPTKYEMKFNYLTTYEYRGFKVKIFDDDYGQQYYFYFNKRCICCGAYNSNYEQFVKHEINHYLDDILYFSDIDSKYIGAYAKYSNQNHTDISLMYRGDEIGHFHSDSSEFNIDDIIKECQNKLDALLDSEEFKKSEQERLAKAELNSEEILERLLLENERNED